MTYFNRLQAELLPTLDSAIVWAIVQLNAAYLSPFNSEIHDPTIRPEVRQGIKWTIQRDATGEIYFVFDVTLYMIDGFPLKKKTNSIIDTIQSPCSYQVGNYDFMADIPPALAGMPVGDIPDEIDTLEQFLYWVSHRLSKWSSFITSWNNNLGLISRNGLSDDAIAQVEDMITRIQDNQIPTWYIPYVQWFAGLGFGGGGDDTNIDAMSDLNFLEDKQNTLSSSVDNVYSNISTGLSPDTQLSDVVGNDIAVIEQCGESAKDAYGGDIIDKVITDRQTGKKR